MLGRERIIRRSRNVNVYHLLLWERPDGAAPLGAVLHPRRQSQR